MPPKKLHDAIMTPPSPPIDAAEMDEFRRLQEDFRMLREQHLKHLEQMHLQQDLVRQQQAHIQQQFIQSQQQSPVHPPRSPMQSLPQQPLLQPQPQPQQTTQSVQPVGDEASLESRMEDLARRVRELESSQIKWRELRESVGEIITGGKPFMEQDTILNAMQKEATDKEWKSKTVRDLASDIRTVMNKLHGQANTDAARELSGLLEVVEAAEGITIARSGSTAWIRKGLEDAVSIVLRLGREHRGHPVLWGCLVKQLLDRVADLESHVEQLQQGRKDKSSSSSGDGCQNCAASGRPFQKHTLGDCFKRGNPCRLPCRFCNLDPSTGAYPMHWRDDCPSYKKRERNYNKDSKGR